MEHDKVKTKEIEVKTEAAEAKAEVKAEAIEVKAEATEVKAEATEAKAEQAEDQQRKDEAFRRRFREQVKLFHDCIAVGVSPAFARRAFRMGMGCASDEDYDWPEHDRHDTSEILEIPLAAAMRYMNIDGNGNSFSAPNMDSNIIHQGRDVESLDSLIESLIAEDGKDPDPEVLSIKAGEIAELPSALLETDIKRGLCDAEVAIRRKKYGWNRMREQKHNYLLQFLSFFNGPVQWVMEVSRTPEFSPL
jgi:magnesium-transporting ATPase (P-type)